jgi:hypothetical protein
MAQLCAGAMYATRPSFHCNSAISESGECPVPKPSRTTSDCAPLGGGTGGSNHLCSRGESVKPPALRARGKMIAVFGLSLRRTRQSKRRWDRVRIRLPPAVSQANFQLGWGLIYARVPGQ